jgi:hypothetical protein
MYSFIQTSSLVIVRLSLAIVVFASSSNAFAQQRKAVSLSIDSIRVQDEDDNFSNDEPYLIVTKFRARLVPSGTTFVLSPGTLQVTGIMSGHNNLGRSSDNWADEVNTYTLPNGIPRVVQEFFPINQSGWVVGAVVVHMEEDAFAASTAQFLSNRIHAEVQTLLSATSFTGFNSQTITNEVARRISSDIRKSIYNLNVGGVIRGLASAVDPDDCGGFCVSLAMTGPNNTLFSYHGSIPTTLNALSLADVVPVTSRRTLTQSFPTADVRNAPYSARFNGRHTIGITVSTWIQAPLF